MDYYKILNFEMEPFSNSPDPGLFYSSAQHLEALQKLEISIRLKRGLNIITGDIGTGKTTISRQLIQKISRDDSIKCYLVLDPGFSSGISFLKYLLHLFEPEKKYESDDENVLKESIKEHLFTNGVDKDINIVLIIDEGQKLSLPCIEILRELLNFETNNQKLLQIIIFAQKEFNQSLEQILNFQDRINFYYKLNPLNFKDSKRLINYRLEKCFIKGKKTTLFTPLGYFLIYMATKGFPRKIVTLCHQIMLSLIIKNKTKANFFFVRSCIKKVFPKKRMVRPSILFAFLFIIIIGSLYAVNDNKINPIFDKFLYFSQKPKVIKKSAPPLKAENPVIKKEKIKLNPSQKPEIKPTIKPEIKPEIKPTIKPEIKPEIEPTIKSEIKPAIGTQIKSAIESSVKSVKKPKIIPEEKKLVISDGIMLKTLKKPDSYGQIKVPENATLARMMRLIYGSFRYSYLNKLIKYNSNLNDPNNIKTGMNINFPVIESSDYLDDKKFFIVLFETDHFKKSFIAAHNYQTSEFNVRILPVWRKDKGFFFPVVINKSFFSLNAANKYKKGQPEIIFAECKTVSQMKNNGKK
jgi:general secretion pathway protein A